MRKNYIKEIKEINNDKGSLSFFEIGKEIDFDIKRIYYIYNFSENQKRGYHAHKKLKQVMWCPHGIIKIDFDDGKNINTYILDHPNKILIVNKGYWREFISLQKDSVFCIGASDIYLEEDYIRNYDKYLEWIKENDDYENII